MIRTCARPVVCAFHTRHGQYDSFKPLLPAIVHPVLETFDDVYEVALDLGRFPCIRRRSNQREISVELRPVTKMDLDLALSMTTPLDARNRCGIPGTLHRVSAIVNATHEIVGLTCRVGQELPGIADDLANVLHESGSMLLIGPPGSGKTSMLRDSARILSESHQVIIVDKSGEIGGHGDTPHPAIGKARRLFVPHGVTQHDVMIEAVENHTPHIIVVDEISTAQESRACQTIAERGVQLVATAHATSLANIIENPALNPLVGGISVVTLGDVSAKARGTPKTVRERTGTATFQRVIELPECTVHDTERIVDGYLAKRRVQ